MEDRSTNGWLVTRNEDLTEGRGRELVHAVCELEATARRLASGASVQGSDGPVTKVKIVIVDGIRYGPVTLIRPIDADVQEQKRLDAARAAEAKARQLGLSEEDLAALRRAP